MEGRDPVLDGSFSVSSSFSRLVMDLLDGVATAVVAASVGRVLVPADVFVEVDFDCRMEGSFIFAIDGGRW